MRHYLLDTNVISEIRKPQPDKFVLGWFAGVAAEQLFLSVLVLGEIAQGVQRLRARDPDRAGAFDAWLHTIETTYRDRLVPVDADVARIWGVINSRQPTPVIDGLLAATALSRNWVLVTRNVNDVVHTGVALLNPFVPRTANT